MQHTEFIREVPGSKTVIVFIHGICGTPNHFSRMVQETPENWSIYNLLLPGHGKSVDAFAASSMAQWKAYVHDLISELNKRYDSILMVGHSMGTLLSIGEAVQNPKIKRLFLLAVPLRVFLKPSAGINSLKVVFHRVRPDDAAAVAAQNTHSITPDKRLWKYAKWIPNYLALLAEIRRTRTKISRIHVPCFVLQSGKDEMVARSSANYFEGNPAIRCEFLPYSSHFFYEASDFAHILNTFKEFCEIDKTML